MAKYKFRLEGGQHVQADKTQKPVVVTSPTTGEKTERFPSRTFRKGEIVESDTNLAARFGADKFTLLSGDASDQSDAYPSASVAPGGQVSTGFQQTSGGVPGPMTAEQAEKFTDKEQSQNQPQQQQPRHMEAQKPSLTTAHEPHRQQTHKSK